MPIPQPTCRDFHHTSSTQLGLIRKLPIPTLVPKLQTQLIYSRDSPHRMSEPIGARNIQRDVSGVAEKRLPQQHNLTIHDQSLPYYR